MKKKIKKEMKQKMNIRFQTYNLESLKTYKDSLKNLALKYNLNFSSINLPVEKKKFTVLKSPHVNKRAKEQFEIRLHNGLITLTTNIFSETLLQTLKTSLQSDVLVKFTLINSKCKN